MSIAIYTRSANPNAASLAHQQAACEDLAVELGYEITRIYSDQGIAQTSLSKLLHDASDGAVNVLLVNTLDRLGRSLATNQHVVTCLHDAGVTIHVAELGKTPVSEALSHRLLSQIIVLCAANQAEPVSE